MRMITTQAIAAFESSKNYSNGATQVNARNDGTELILHGNTIARRIDGEGLSINLCGRNTQTTRERLSGLPNVSVTTKKGQAFLNGNPIPSNGWVKVG